MGYIVSSLTDPDISPQNLNEYCIYLIHEWNLDGVSKDLSTHFREYGRRLGRNASIFTASNQGEYDKSLIRIFNHDPWFKSTLGNYYDLPPGIIITKPSLPRFRAVHNDVFIFVSSEVINLAYHFEEDLSQELVDLCRRDDNSFIERILPYSRGALVDSGPRTNKVLDVLRDSIMIEPNINGFGFRIKPIAQHAIKSRFLHGLSRTEEKKASYDCVIYRF